MHRANPRTLILQRVGEPQPGIKAGSGVTAGTLVSSENKGMRASTGSDVTGGSEKAKPSGVVGRQVMTDVLTLAPGRVGLLGEAGTPAPSLSPAAAQGGEEDRRCRARAQKKDLDHTGPGVSGSRDGRAGTATAPYRKPLLEAGGVTGTF